MHTSMTFFKLDFTLGYRNTIVNLNATTCNVNNGNEMNIIRRIHACKKTFLLALVLVHSTVVDTIFDTSSTILVTAPVDAGFFGGVRSHFSIRSTFVLNLTFRLELLMKIDELALDIAYLIPLLIYQQQYFSYMMTFMY